MSRRTMSICLWTAALVAALGLTARSQAKPPDLPLKSEHTVTPDVLPDSEWPGPAPLPRDEAGNVIAEQVPLPVVLPLAARLAPVQRRHFASVLLFGVHPLLTLVPTDRLVDLPCDHPGCVVVENPTGTFIIGVGTNTAGMKCEFVPLPKDVHGSIEIGIGFSLNGAPTYKFLVTEHWGCGNCRKNETLQGCVTTLGRALVGEMFTTDKPTASGDCEEQETGRPCEPGVAVMVDGLMKSCYLSLAAGRFGHAADVARQAFALDPKRVKNDAVVYKLYQMAQEQARHGDCCEDCSGCPQCPFCKGNSHEKAIAKPYLQTSDAPAGVGKGD